MKIKDALTQVMAELDRTGEVLSSSEIKLKAQFLVEDSARAIRERAAFDSLASKNLQRQMKPITTLNALTAPVLRDLVQSSAGEFLGEEFWMSLKTQSERLAVKRTFEFMRQKITRGMC